MLFNSKKCDIYKKLGFLLIFAQSHSFSCEFFGSKASGDSVVLLKMISSLINTQIFGLQIIEYSPTDIDDLSDSDSDSYNIYSSRLPSYFVKQDFTAEEIAALKRIDHEIIASMDRVWGKIENSQFNKEYIKSCIRVVKRTFRFNYYQIQVDLPINEILARLYIPKKNDWRYDISSGRDVLDIIRILELVSEKSFKTALEIFAKFNKYDVRTWRVKNILDDDHVTNESNEIIREIISQFYEVDSNDIVHIAYMINRYMRICRHLGCLEGFDYFKHKNNIPEHYKFFYPYTEDYYTLMHHPFHGMQGLPDVVTVKFGPIRGLYDRLLMEPDFVEFMRGKKSIYFYSANDISLFKELRIQLIDVKSGSAAQYERYALQSGEYYNISNGNKLLAMRSFKASREKDDPIPKIEF